jgi:hypothetical protein
MKRILLALLLPVATGCLIDNDLAEHDDVSAETRISNEKDDWCAAACEKLSGCDGEAVTGDCPAECRSYLEKEFLDHGEACAQAGVEFMECIENATCQNLMVPDSCALSQAQEAACDEDDTPPTPGGPVNCNGHSSQGIAPGATTFECGTEATDCSDGHTYSSHCVEGTDGHGECTCSIDGNITSSFELAELVCPTEAAVVTACGFPFESVWEADAGPPPSVCQGASGGGGPADGSWGCSSEFHCDGAVYAVICAEDQGLPSCACYLNGELEITFVDPDLTTCPGNGMAEDIAVINHGCGWNIGL